MADMYWLERQARSNQNGANEARRRAKAMESQLSSVREEIAELEKEKGELERFKNRIGRDASGVQSQLQMRQRFLSQMAEIKNVQLAKELFSSINDNEMRDASKKLSSGIQEASYEVGKAIGVVKRRIEELRRQEQSLGRQISEQYNAATHLERAANEARRVLREEAKKA